MLKRNVQTNDDEIFDEIKSQGIKYYRYYAILDSQEEKLYVANFEEAEKIVNDLKEKIEVEENEPRRRIRQCKVHI